MRQLRMMALLTLSVINRNRCLTLKSASLIAARARSQHREQLIGNLLRTTGHERFSALSATNACFPPANFPGSAPIAQNVKICPEKLYTLCYDGRSRRGGGGMSGSGVVLYDDHGIEIWSSSHHYAGETSIYEASYRGLIDGLLCAKSLGLKHIAITGCNELVHKQIAGLNQVRKTSLQDYYHEVMSLKQDFASFQVNYVDKTKNERARQLAQISMGCHGSTIEQTANTKRQLPEKKTKEIEEDGVDKCIDINLDPISESMDTVNADRVYILHFSGTSRGNSGAAGSGMVLYDIDGHELWSGCQYLGERNTNNEAEYIGLITGLRVARILGIEHIIVQGNGPLILRQIEGTNKVNNAKLKPYYDRAMSLRGEFVSFYASRIERTQNGADKLANEAIDTQGSSFEAHHIDKTRTETSRPSNGEEDIDDELEQYIAATLEDEDGNISANNTADTRSEATISYDQNRAVTTLDPQMTYILCFDGGSRGNPGKAGAGMVLYESEGGSEIWSGCQYIGEMITNNEAEYKALITGLRVARSMGIENILVQGDSQLILRQIDGVYRVKSEKLRSYYDEAMSLRREFASFRTNHIERTRNTRADELANEAMNNKSSRGIF